MQSKLITKIKKSIKILPAEVGQKLCKFTLKFHRNDKTVQMSVTGYSFGKEEVLIELYPKKELQISIESASPLKGKEVLRF